MKKGKEKGGGTPTLLSVEGISPACILKKMGKRKKENCLISGQKSRGGKRCERLAPWHGTRKKKKKKKGGIRVFEFKEEGGNAKPRCHAFKQREFERKTT